MYINLGNQMFMVRCKKVSFFFTIFMYAKGWHSRWNENRRGTVERLP